MAHDYRVTTGLSLTRIGYYAMEVASKEINIIVPKGEIPRPRTPIFRADRLMEEINFLNFFLISSF